VNAARRATRAELDELRRLVGRRSSRVQAQRFVIEGPVFVADAIQCGLDIGPVFVERSMVDRVPPNVDVAMCDDGALAKVLDAVSPQPMATTAPLLLAPLDRLVGATFVLLCDQVADPGNLGTIIRAAEAAGADAVVVTPGTVDVHSPKVVRSTAGALFRVPMVEASLAEVKAAGLRLVATSSHAAVAYDQVDLTRSIAIVVGNEAHGLSDDAIHLCDELMAIPHAGRSESLNVAMAASVVAFEVLRQRRTT
jgi:RNA methyltransferase, TrmH family